VLETRSRTLMGASPRISLWLRLFDHRRAKEKTEGLAASQGDA
jgi:hypothetical protein